MVSESVELCESEVCFLHIQLLGTNVWLPKMHKSPPDVDFESSRSPAKSESWNSPNLHCFAIFPHDNISCIHLCDACKRSNEIIVCHNLWYILWSIVQVCSLTIEHPVVQYVPNIIISEQFESIILTILTRISVLLLWNDGYQCMKVIHCRVVESSCSPTHKIVPHTSWLDPPCHKTTKRYADFLSMVIFSCSYKNSGFKHGSVIVYNIFANFTLSLSASQVYMIKEWCWFSQINFFV